MKKILLIASSLVALGVVAALIYYVSACPCDRIPGVALWGEEVVEPVSDWTFANDTGLCQLQVSNGVLPQSLNLNCMSGDGDLFVSCAQCDGKRWSTTALAHPNGRVKIGDRVYPVVLTRLTDSNALDAAWLARAIKLRNLGRDTPNQRPDHWWSFQLSSP